MSSSFAAELLSDPEGLVVLTAPDGTVPEGAVVEHLSSIPCVVVAIDRAPGESPLLADVAPEEPVASVDDILRAVTANPVAAVSLALLLRTQPASLGAGLAAESAVYSLLQSGAEFATWRATRTAARRSESGAAIKVERAGDRVDIVLSRPHVRNALNVAMRDALLDALSMAGDDTSIARLVVRGEGSSFCSGGDLNEFGTFSDPAAAHVVRLHASVGRALVALGSRLTVQVHGPCAGSGVELAAFAPHVVARPDFTAQLPEVTLGLIPGAGGTVSIRRRIGRHRTALLALGGTSVDAVTSLRWGLVDEVIG